MTHPISEKTGDIDNVITELQAAKDLQGTAGGNIHLLLARANIDRMLHQLDPKPAKAYEDAFEDVPAIQESA